jgi:uncharacterized protein (TIRG00374 family)
MIRSSLESKIYILQRTFSRYQGEPVRGSCPRADGMLPYRRPTKTFSAGAPFRAFWCRVTALSLRRRRQSALLLLAALVLVALFAFRARGTAFNWKLFVNTVRDMSWIWLSLAILLTLLTYVGRALRWEVMLRPLGRKVSIARLTSDTVIGFMAATLLGRLGELVRPYLISLSARVSFSSQIAAWLLERVLDLLAVLLIFGFALIRVPSQGLRLGPGLHWTLTVGGELAVFMALLCLAILIAFRQFTAAARERVLSALSFLPAKYHSRSRKMIDAFAEGVQATRRAGPLALLTLYTGLEWAVIIASYGAMLRCFSATRSLKTTDVIVILGFVAFGSIFQIPGVGGGLQITTILVLREIYGLPLEAASGIALLIWIIVLLLVVPLGLACALYHGMNWHKIKELALEKVPQQEEL